MPIPKRSAQCGAVVAAGRMQVKRIESGTLECELVCDRVQGRTACETEVRREADSPSLFTQVAQQTTQLSIERLLSQPGESRIPALRALLHEARFGIS